MAIIRRKINRICSSKNGWSSISRTAGKSNYVKWTQIVKLILASPNDPVFVMFDDSGLLGEGPGEIAIKYVASIPISRCVGIIAVASKTHQAEWTRVDVSQLMQLWRVDRSTFESTKRN